MLDVLENQEEGHSIVIVTFKLLIVLFGTGMAILNLTADFYYSDFGVLFPDLEGLDFGSYLFAYSVMIVFVQALGAVLYLVEELPQYREAVRPALLGYLIWDCSLLLLMLEGSFMQYYCYNTMEFMFDDGFYDLISKYRNESRVAESIDWVQSNFWCCGNANYTEWLMIDWNDRAGSDEVSIPESCCNLIAAQARNETCIYQIHYSYSYKLMPYPKGCLDVMKYWYGMYFYTNGCLLIACWVTHGFCLGLTVFMFLSPRKGYSALERKKLIFKQAILFRAATEGGLIPYVVSRFNMFASFTSYFLLIFTLMVVGVDALDGGDALALMLGVGVFIAGVCTFIGCYSRRTSS